MQIKQISLIVMSLCSCTAFVEEKESIDQSVQKLSRIVEIVQLKSNCRQVPLKTKHLADFRKKRILIIREILQNPYGKDTIAVYNLDSSLLCSSVKYQYGNLFSATHKHLVVERCGFDDYTEYLEIYHVENDSFFLVCSSAWGDLTFLDYSIRDVNGDSRKDFLVHWYPSSGCCLRDCYDVYLQKNASSFSVPVEFINPTFYPGEKLVRGVGYGHPEEVELYKFRWRGFEIDTVEFIFLDWVDSVSYNIVSSDNLNRNDTLSWKILKAVPSEYKQMEAYSWFYAD